MDEIEMLRQYGARTRGNMPPGIDVTAEVLETLRRDGMGRRVDLATRPLVMAAAAGWLVAVTCGLFAHQAWSVVDDPLGALVTPFVVALE
jgi:hypothetical protein